MKESNGRHLIGGDQQTQNRGIHEAIDRVMSIDMAKGTDRYTMTIYKHRRGTQDETPSDIFNRLFG